MVGNRTALCLSRSKIWLFFEQHWVLQGTTSNVSTAPEAMNLKDINKLYFPEVSCLYWHWSEVAETLATVPPSHPRPHHWHHHLLPHVPQLNWIFESWMASEFGRGSQQILISPSEELKYVFEVYQFNFWKPEWHWQNCQFLWWNVSLLQCCLDNHDTPCLLSWYWRFSAPNRPADVFSQNIHNSLLTRLQLALFLRPPLDTVPQDDGVLYQGEEDQHDTGKQPNLQGCHWVRDGYLRSVIPQGMNV